MGKYDSKNYCIYYEIFEVKIIGELVTRNWVYLPKQSEAFLAPRFDVLPDKQ